MITETILTPSKANPITVVLRLIPQNIADEKQIKLLDKALRGTTAVHTTPLIEKKTCLSVIWSAHNKRAGSK